MCSLYWWLLRNFEFLVWYASPHLECRRVALASRLFMATTVFWQPCDSVTALDGKWMTSIMKTALGLQWQGARSRSVPKHMFKKYTHVCIFIYIYIFTYLYIYIIYIYIYCHVQVLYHECFHRYHRTQCVFRSFIFISYVAAHQANTCPDPKEGRGKSRSKLCYLLHLEKLARLLKPTAKKCFIFTVGATKKHSKSNAIWSEVNEETNPSTVWRSGDHITEGLLKMWELPIHGIPKRKKKHFKEMKCRSWWQKLQDFSSALLHRLRKPNKSPPFFWQKRLCTQRDDV